MSKSKYILISSNNNWCSTILFNMLNVHKNVHSDPFCKLLLGVEVHNLTLTKTTKTIV